MFCTSMRMASGANQGIQDAYALAKELSKIGHEHRTLDDALEEYQNMRKTATAAIMRSSTLVGNLETQKGLGRVVRNTLFRIAGSVGIVGKAFINAAAPRVLGR